MRYIPKYEDGGRYIIPTFAVYSHSGVPGSTSKEDDDDKKTKKEEKEEGLLDTKMLDKLFESGLVNDVNKFVGELIKLEQQSSLPFLNQQNRAQALAIRAKINELAQTKDYWTQTFSRVKESEGLSEIATSNGHIYHKVGNTIKAMPISTYASQANRIRPLTVQELLYERQFNPSLAGQNNVFTVADNAIGMKKIATFVKEMISVIGSHSDEKTYTYAKADAIKALQQLTGKKPSASEYAALEALTQVANSPTLYSEVTTSNKSSASQLPIALNFIWTALGTPAQEKLRAVAASQGSTNPLSIIEQMLTVSPKSESKTVVKPVKDESIFSKPEKPEKPEKVALSPVELQLGDRVNQPGLDYVLTGPEGLTLHMTTQSVGPLFSLDKRGEVLSPAMISTIMSSQNYQMLVDPNQAYIGETHVDSLALSELAYSGNDVAKVYVPTTDEGHPDFARLPEFQKLYTEFLEIQKTMSTLQAETWFTNQGFPGIKIHEVKDANGNVIKTILENSKVKPFLALPVYTTGGSDLSEIPWMQKLIGSEAERAQVIMDRAFITISGTNAKPKIEPTKPGTWLNNAYKGTLLIAFRPNANMILSSVSGHMYGSPNNVVDVSRNFSHSTNSGDAYVNASSDVLQSP